MNRGLTGLFALTLFLAAGLLFSAQPMIARTVLPVLGGSPAVWTTCMLFFQAELLAAYAYAHVLTDRLSPHVQLATHTCLLIASWTFLPIATLMPNPTGLAASTSPTAGLLALLTRSVGLPFFAVAASAPLLQRWFAEARRSTSPDPYFLYAASNAGSLVALLAYPLWVERAFGLARQSALWGQGYSVLAFLVAACGLASALSLGRAGKVVTAADEPARISPRTWLGWVVLALIPSSLLLGVTSYLTTDLAAVPLLWVIPLGLYLLSFIVVFARRRDSPDRFWPGLLPLLVMPLAVAIGVPIVEPFWLVVPLHLAGFFGAAMVCHGALARSRPAASGLTSFYLALAVGGAAGGVLNAVVAPVVFNRVAEYPLALVAACLVLAFRPGAGGRSGLTIRDLVLPGVVGLLTALLCVNRGGLSGTTLGAVGTAAASGLAILAAVTYRSRPARFGLTIGGLLLGGSFASGVTGRVLYRERSFFGVMSVTEVADGDFHRLFHGSTLHGQQCMSPSRRREPLTYFDRTGPVGQVFETFEARPEASTARVAVTGVGAGSLASYARKGQAWTFHEIDPAVVRVARDPRYFTYLSDSPASTLDVVLGDARLELARAPDSAYDLLILDAFSSDAIPAHLLTRESIALYRRKLKPRGWLVFNISNRYLDLAPVVALLASNAGLVCRVRVDAKISAEEKARGKQGSIWAVMAASEADLGGLATDPRWRAPRAVPGDRVWTDDRSNIVRHFRFGALRAGRRRGGDGNP